MLRNASLCLVLVGMFLLAGCGGSKSSAAAPGTPTPSPSPITATGQGQLYVSDSAHNTIFRFSGALTTKGALNANATINGTLTTLANPGNVAVDPIADRLFVANRGGASPSIVIFEQAHLATGNVAPTRSISGNVTQLVAPVDMAVDTGNDLLYVADKNLVVNNVTPGPGSILVFAAASTISGNTPPARTFNLPFLPTAIFLNMNTQTLYVADGVHNAIDIFTNVNNLPTGVITTNQIVAKGNNAVDMTTLANPNGLLVDSTGQLLIVSNAGSQSITVYAGAATITGNVAPKTTIGGATTGIASPSQMAFNGATNDVYLADGSPGTAGGGILIFNNVANAATGSLNIAPSRTINGVNPGATAPNNIVVANGVALDITR